MSLSFPQTTRALQADDDRSLLVWLSFAMIIFALWFYWFFEASISHYVSSRELSFKLEPQPVWIIPEGESRPIAHRRYQLKVTFPVIELAQIKAGQRIKASLKSNDTLPRRALSGRVERVLKAKGYILVYLLVRTDNADPLFDAHIKRLDVEVYVQSPAEFLFHRTDTASHMGM